MAAVPACIGPNAVTQTAAALDDRLGHAGTVQVFTAAGLLPWLQNPPERMVDEQAVARLHAAVRQCLDRSEASAVMAEAGRRTGAYILAHRIPAAARRLLPVLPARWAMPLLLNAVGRHAWTFVGSGVFEEGPGPDFGSGRHWTLTIRNNPLAREEQWGIPICGWHRAVFETLFQKLVRCPVQVEETHCLAAGDDRCAFRLSLS